MNEATPQLAANPAGLYYLNSVHGLYLAGDRRDVAELLALAAVNSATAAVDKDSEEEMSKMTGGLNIPGLG